MVEESTCTSSIRVQTLYHEEDSVDLVDLPSDKETWPRWLQDTLRDVERHAAPRGTFKERKPLKFFRAMWSL
jgi:hypothetical protein